MESSLLTIATGAAIVGVLSHQRYFIRGEWDRHALTLLYIFIVSPLALTLFLTVSVNSAPVLRLWLVIWASYTGGLLLSIAVYRVVFHSSCQFPGPFAARITAFWSFRNSAVQLQWHKRVQSLHETYGDFVRIKPREISINDPFAIKDIHSASTQCSKGPFYDLNYPHQSLQMTRDKRFHSTRRRLWDRGLGTKAQVEYEPFIQEHCEELARQLGIRHSKPVEVTTWINWFAFDTMGRLVFGKSFDMLKASAYHPRMEQLEKVKKLGGLLHCGPWTLVMLRNLPLIRHKAREWIDWCAEQVEERRQRGLANMDLFHFLIQQSVGESKSTGDASAGFTDQDLIYDSELAIVAGSDTTAATTSAILFLLAQNRECLTRLREEIAVLRSTVPTTAASHSSLAALPYLNGCINEGLRLYPAVMSGTQRQTGPNGAVIAGRFIPPDTLVSTPTYTLHRDPRNFTLPDNFIPERWSTRPELVLRREAFNPFSTGPYACAGKSIALMEMRMLLVTLVGRFDFTFAPGYDTKALSLASLGGHGVQDCFTTHVPPYELVFTKVTA
ncbi:cytochrome P450 [Aspergillus candidus]|uniref:Cytochrome P450 n=1 Tax=Aspergillus candidus TaxID=41067 RepID=A0A2I2FKD9_ASPCN|nr:cytochrome P450 [Aspergillus candidus]PLB41072.1 cytochrome P450 [Aspergillus candidus]